MAKQGNFSPEEAAEVYDEDFYKYIPKSEKETFDVVAARVVSDADGWYQKYANAEDIKDYSGSENVDTMFQLSTSFRQQARAAKEAGNMELAQDLYAKSREMSLQLAKLERNAGQELQALQKYTSMADRALVNAEKLIQDRTEQFVKDNPRFAKQIDDVIDQVTDILEEAEKYGINSKDRVLAESQAYSLLADQVAKSSFMDKWNAWRYLSMLGNTKTHGRNLVSTASMYAINGVKNNVSAAQSLKSQIRELKKPVDLLERGRQYAKTQADEAAFHQDSGFAKRLTKFSKDLSEGKVISELTGLETEGNPVEKAVAMAIEGVVPFKKTPANVLKNSLAYSPANVVKNLFSDLPKLVKGKKTAADFIDSLSKTLTGLGIMAVGAYLYYKGIVSPQEDSETGKFDSLQGKQA